jgi:hypothetical protein
MNGLNLLNDFSWPGDTPIKTLKERILWVRPVQEKTRYELTFWLSVGHAEKGWISGWTAQPQIGLKHNWILKKPCQFHFFYGIYNFFLWFRTIHKIYLGIRHEYPLSFGDCVIMSLRGTPAEAGGPKQSHKASKTRRLPRLRAETPLRRAGTLPSVARNDQGGLRHSLYGEGVRRERLPCSTSISSECFVRRQDI